MAKIGRNDACLCGSGKKYKKCCMGKQNNVSITPQDAKDFQELLPRLFDYSKKYDDVLQPLYQRYTNTFERLQRKDAQAFSQLLFHWLVFNHPNAGDGKTILKKFVEEHQSQYSDRFQRLLTKWNEELQPRLMSVEKKESEQAVLKDELEGSVVIPEPTGVTQHLSEGDLLVGYLYPSPAGIILGSDAVVLPKKYESVFLKEWTELYDNYNKKEQKQSFYTANFTSVVGVLTMIALNKVAGFEEQELSEQAKGVWAELTSHVNLNDYSYDVLLDAKAKWMQYVGEKQPRIQKPAVFAAALEYWMTKQANQWTTLTQKEAAAKYKVSAATISSRFKELNA
ncbi:SEC-C domain-containing protein [Bacillus shivajii]|uniref:YecA family protein n=1 Tax=Bacillus shivajii TaxID=1983719 RepID=UPI001CFBA0B0|nr:SEC-C metal-binding domain-containing protein [Bacillus shivajii]UCZ53833.1 SEC-C domain-containing protein [Bacillus shivajii]